MFILCCCNREPDARKAGLDFCNCLKTYEPEVKDSAFKICHDYISEKYELLKIYYNTRDTSIYDLYDQVTIDKVNKFVTKFAKEVDNCGPPFWFKSN